MSDRLSTNIGVALSLLIAVCTIAISEHAVAQSACPGGTVAITDATRAAATAAGLPASVQCWSPSDPNTGEAAGDAKIWLAQHALKSVNIACLNPQFAEKLETFMQAVPGGVPVITFGYRTVAEENADIANGSSKLKNACSGYHLYGLAVDFNNASAQTTQWMRLNAPQYGLAPTGVNPTTGCASSGFCDPGHIQSAGPLPPSNECGVCNSTGNNGTLTAGNATTPTTGISNAIRSVFSPQTTAQYAQPTSVAPITSPITSPVSSTGATSACTPQYICSNGNVYYQSDSCATSVFQACEYGCSGTVCSPAPTSSTTNVQTNVIATTSLQADTLLQQFITTTPATTTSTASTNTPVSLNTSIYTIVQGELTSQTAPTTATSSFSGTNYAEQTLSDNEDGQTESGDQNSSQLGQLIFSLKTALGGLLTYLQPFGGQLPA